MRERSFKIRRSVLLRLTEVTEEEYFLGSLRSVKD